MAAPTKDSALEEPFIPATAIFTPFKGFALSTKPPSTTDPIKTTIESVIAQQALVRSQIISMIETRAKSLVSKAEAEIASLGPGPTGAEDGDFSAANRKRETDELIARLNVPMKIGKDVKDYIYRPGVKFVDPSRVNGKRDGDGDVAMDDATSSLLRLGRPTARQIWARLELALQQLTDQAVVQLEGYDVHAEKVLRD